MINKEDIKVGSCLQITKGNLIKIAGPVFADKIDPSGSIDRIQHIKVISILDKKCEVVSFFKPELAAVCVDIVELAMFSIFSSLKELSVEKAEQVSHPSHYAWLKDLCGVEPIEICQHFDFSVGNALKYLMRNGKVERNLTEKEQRIQDLEKAIYYIKNEIDLIKNDSNNKDNK